MTASFSEDTAFIRGGLALLLALFMCFLCAESGVDGISNIIIIGVLWYASNSILKPRGSYLYTFWGKGRAIANEFLMAAMVITSIVCSRGAIKKEELISLLIAFAFSFVAAIIAIIVNEYL